MSLRRFVYCLMAAVLFASVMDGAAQAGSERAVRGRVSSRPQTTGPALFFTIKVTISNTRITLSRHDLPRTYSARFSIRNVGTKAHSFTLGTGPRGTRRGVVVSRVVKPKTSAVAFLINAEFRGVLNYYSSVAGDRGKPGFQGTFTIS
jgi:hypothetical protein